MKLTFKQWKQIETMLQCDYIAKQDEYLKERQRLEKSGVDHLKRIPRRWQECRRQRRI